MAILGVREACTGNAAGKMIIYDTIMDDVQIYLYNPHTYVLIPQVLFLYVWEDGMAKGRQMAYI